MDEINQKNKTSKIILLENSKVKALNKDTLETSHNLVNSYKINNKALLLSSNSYYKKLNKEKIRYGLLGINHLKNKKNFNNKNESENFLSFINNISFIKNKKPSRNYIPINSNLINNTTDSKCNSSSLNNKFRILKTMHNNYSYTKTNTLNKSSKSPISSKFTKFSNYNEKNKLNKSYLNNQKGNGNEIILNAKPIIKKKENLIKSKLWSKLISNIDQKKNDKINKLKKKCMNKVNIDTNTNININIQNNIVINHTENEISQSKELNKKDSNLENNKEIRDKNKEMKPKNNASKKFFSKSISLNKNRNYNPLEVSNSTESIKDEITNLRKERKIKFNKRIEEREKEKNRMNSINLIKQEKNYTKIKKRNNSLKNINLIKKEKKLNDIYSSLLDEINNEDIKNLNNPLNDYETDTFKTNDNKMENKIEDEIDYIKNKKEDNIFDINEHSFIGNNSYHRVNKKLINRELSEKENDNYLFENNIKHINMFTTYNKNQNNKDNEIKINIPNYSTYQSDNFKIFRLLSNNLSYNVSYREIHEESPKLLTQQNINENYHFIYEIEKNNTNIKNLSKKKFLNLKDNCVFKILSFGIDIYLPLMKSDIYIKNKINKAFNNFFENIINDFKFQYKDYLQVIHFKFEHNKIMPFFHKNDYILDLVIYCKIISKNIEKSIEISCNYCSNKKRYDYMWKFDLQKKTKINKWIATEINIMKNYHKPISYVSQVSAFSYGDEIQININIFNFNNILEPTSLEWCPPIISNIFPKIFEKNKFINKIQFDPLRACEVEKQVLVWHDKLNNDGIVLFDEIKEIFKDYFEIKCIKYDKSKYYFYKIIMVPKKVGYILKNKFCSFDINIIDFQTPVKNEIQCIYLINTNNCKNKMDIRMGTTLTLYIIDMQII